jgi:hypothetical protein
MCLIIYAPKGQHVRREHFYKASQDNNDGIGIMSMDGIEKFLGRKKTKRAYAYARSLADAGVPYAVHFRYATHGRVSRENTHPFEIPGTPYYMMHNGILWTHKDATEDRSDTAIFAQDIMPIYMDWKDSDDHAGWKETLCLEADYSRLVLLDSNTGKFEIVNEKLGDWFGGLWFSNLYSCYDAPLPPLYLTAAMASKATSAPQHTPMASGPAVDYSDETETAGQFYRRRVRELRDGSKFDWHDSSTWSKYPLPGSWDDRFPLAEDRDGPDYDATDDRMVDPTDGVQHYI